MRGHQQHRVGITIVPRRLNPPASESWWIGQPPERFTARAESEVARMGLARVSIPYESMGDVNRRRKRTYAEEEI